MISDLRPAWQADAKCAGENPEIFFPSRGVLGLQGRPQPVGIRPPPPTSKEAGMIDDSIEFDVHGIPAPQGDKSAVIIAGRARLIEGRRNSSRERHHNWRTAVADTARRHAPDLPLDGPLCLNVTFRSPMPASRPKRARDAGQAPKTTAPDLDKLLRATCDGLQASGLITDDARIAVVCADKLEVVGWTGAHIRITRIRPDQ